MLILSVNMCICCFDVSRSISCIYTHINRVTYYCFPINIPERIPGHRYRVHCHKVRTEMIRSWSNLTVCNALDTVCKYIWGPYYSCNAFQLIKNAYGDPVECWLTNVTFLSFAMFANCVSVTKACSLDIFPCRRYIGRHCNWRFLT